MSWSPLKTVHVCTVPVVAAWIVAFGQLHEAVAFWDEGDAGARVPLMGSEDAWCRLPVDHSEPVPTLPNWARAFAHSLPRTTAAMLDLDYRHRTRSPLDPVLRAQIRWVAADANKCPYALAYAEADLRRLGASEAEIQRLAGDWSTFPEEIRLVLEWARTMTLEADKATDSEVARILELYGEQKLTAMVLLLAYANFQDRLLLTLGIPLEAGGPLPPLAVVIDKEAMPVELPERAAPEGPKPEVAQRVDDSAWRALDFDALQTNLTRQREAPGRIRVPAWEEVLAALPPGATRPPRPIRIQWTLVCMGYQPELAMGWSACTGAFRDEAKQDRVFEESLFWVVTNTIHCFY
jgi:AhpD family alkylhydroperoxidase